MKYVFVISSLRPGGAEKVCIGLINEFYRQGFDVSLIVLNLDNAHLLQYLSPAIPLYNLKVPHAASCFFRLARIMKELKADRCLSFNFQLSVVLVLIKKFFKLDFLLYSRGINTFSKKISEERVLRYRYFNAILIRRLYKKSDFFIAQSTGMKADMVHALGIDEKKIRIIFNPMFTLQKIEVEVHRKQSSVKEILFVGSLKHQKNLPFLMLSIKELSWSRQDFIFRIVGDGPLRDDLKTIAKELGIVQFVSFEGFSPNPASFYKDADLVVLGSLYEGFPNVLVEAISYGVPVVSVDCKSGPSDIVKPEINGFLVDKFNARDFALKVSLALDKNWDKELLAQSISEFRFSNIFDQYKSYLTDERED